MSNLGGMEVLVIFVLALMVLGPERLPKVARQAGQVMRQVRQMSSGFQEELRSAIEDPRPTDFHGSSVAASAEPVVEPTPDSTEIDSADAEVDGVPPSAASAAPVGDRRLSAVPEPEPSDDSAEQGPGSDSATPPTDGSRAAG